MFIQYVIGLSTHYFAGRESFTKDCQIGNAITLPLPLVVQNFRIEDGRTIHFTNVEEWHILRFPIGRPGSHEATHATRVTCTYARQLRRQLPDKTICQISFHGGRAWIFNDPGVSGFLRIFFVNLDVIQWEGKISSMDGAFPDTCTCLTRIQKWRYKCLIWSTTNRVYICFWHYMFGKKGLW